MNQGILSSGGGPFSYEQMLLREDVDMSFWHQLGISYTISSYSILCGLHYLQFYLVNVNPGLINPGLINWGG